MSLTLLDWRRRVHALYAEVRAADDPRAAHELWRHGRDRLFATHPDSPLPAGERSGFAGLVVAPYDPSLRFEVQVDTDVTPEHLEVPTGTDGVVPFDRVGVAHLGGLGDLDVWWLGSYGGGLFVPVKDGLAGRETYGGGRYLWDSAKGADLGSEGDELVLDFNYAYHPSCVYDRRWSCPLAPVENRLAVPIAAGERLEPAP